MLGLNQAVADGLVFGRDIKFTFGPYSSVYSQLYHPSTYGMILIAGGILAAGYGWALFRAFSRGGRDMFLAGVVLALGALSRDALLLSYPVLYVLAVQKVIVSGQKGRKAEADKRSEAGQLLALAISSAGLAALLLVKGSIFPLATIAFLAVLGLSVAKRSHAAMVTIAASAILGSLLLWILAGQPIGAFPGYFAGLATVISGYSEAMAVSGRSLDLVIFAAIGLSALAIALFESADRGTRLLRGGILTLFGFVAFKAGFVRHDWHATIAAGCAVVMLAICLSFVRNRVWALMPVLVAALFGWYDVERHNQQIPAPYLMLFKAKQVLADPFVTAARLIEDGSYLSATYARTLAELNRQFGFPIFEGRADVYSFWQSDLIASGSSWHPRPTLQSYSAYTGALARANADYLRGSRAPDRIAFRITPIDRNFPTLADGASWPALLTRYAPYEFKENFLYLARTEEGPREPLTELGRKRAVIGAYQPVPESRYPIFVEIEVRKSLFGKIADLFYKPRNLTLEVRTATGATKSYRYVSGMGREGFMLSPIVANSTELAELYAGDEARDAKKVVAVRLVAEKDMFPEWLQDIEIRFYAVNLPHRPKVSIRFAYDPVVRQDVATGTRHQNTDACLGGVDVLNEVYPAPRRVDIGAILSVDGWLAVPGATRSEPGTVYLILTDSAGQTTWVRARRSPRIDVKALFGDPFGPDLGFDAYIDPSAFHGQYEMGIAWTNGDEWAECEWPAHLLTFPDADAVSKREVSSAAPQPHAGRF
ncbi:hypothetical protein [Breoghania sp. JC706]|uniref:hypothetical protein n=1 Tax=Breoghania sp. JC706 TaxID=3117732 RepID=UPI00300B8CB2